MQHSRFLVLTGHLNDYPLSDLVGILRHQQKTGRLLIEYPNSPASFFFNDGELVDAQLDHLRGLQAVCVALAQPPASFNFNPLIQPTRRSIENSLQKVVSELLGCWGENDLEVETIAPVDSAPQPALMAVPSGLHVDQSKIDNSAYLALPPAPANGYSRPIMAMAAAGLLLLGLSTVIAVAGRFVKSASSATVISTQPQISNDSSPRQGNDDLSENPKRVEFSNHSGSLRPVSKGKEAAPGLDQLRQPEIRNLPVNENQMRSAEQPGIEPSMAKADSAAEVKQAKEARVEGHSVKVVLQIEDGRVAQASIANRRSGMEAYEALALRIARQRRYPSTGAAQQTITIKVGSPE